ncbi:hypothetical protein [Candidatus Cyanaurora vandensis]|uniref:hypothetical protein n=1 Tax=Candidatus Cyanaurora vandensis TaxID=2714958 RepID=UPI00257FFCD1|nr:hypothetical protein [Candidatus Cyanaurora vandensis]
MSQRPFTVFTKTATARILGVAVALVKKLQVLAKTIWVYVQGKRPTFISKTRYKVDYLESRLDRSADIKITPVGGFSYTAHNLSNGKEYRLWCAPGRGLQCECKDYERQVQGGKVNPTCKHKLAVNQFLSDRFRQQA